MHLSYIQGRTFDGHVLDMFEFGIENFQSINHFDGMKKTIGSKPMLIFLGIQYYQLFIILLYYLILFYTLYF